MSNHRGINMGLLPFVQNNSILSIVIVNCIHKMVNSMAVWKLLFSSLVRSKDITSREMTINFSFDIRYSTV